MQQQQQQLQGMFVRTAFLFFASACVYLILFGYTIHPSLQISKHASLANQEKQPTWPKPNGKQQQVSYFVHLSDLHLSEKAKFEAARFAPLHALLTQHVPHLIQPDFVVVTGDITDARENATHMKTQQHEKEWQQYTNLLEQVVPLIEKNSEKRVFAQACNATTSWLDLKGVKIDIV